MPDQRSVSDFQLGVGAWQWGDRFFWGYGRSYRRSDVRAAFETSLMKNVAFIDTAEFYGFGRSERLIGEFIQNQRQRIYIASKFFPYPWRLSKGRLLAALRGSLRRLGLKQLDLYQLHWPSPPIPIETWMDSMAEAHAEGLIREIGISNCRLSTTLRASDALEKHGLRLASNQILFNLLHRNAEFSGLLEACHSRGIALIAYSPLAQGMLTGKYSSANPLPRIRARGRNMQTVEPLLDLLREIGAAVRTPAQVALNWLIAKGAIPIPGPKNGRQAEENAGSVGWSLSTAEIARLDAASHTGSATRGVRP
jgi:aryl-alcohol dehydrogenase-like predicted oxidoreductase